MSSDFFDLFERTLNSAEFVMLSQTHPYRLILLPDGCTLDDAVARYQGAVLFLVGPGDGNEAIGDIALSAHLDEGMAVLVFVREAHDLRQILCCAGVFASRGYRMEVLP